MLKGQKAQPDVKRFQALRVLGAEGVEGLIVSVWLHGLSIWAKLIISKECWLGNVIRPGIDWSIGPSYLSTFLLQAPDIILVISMSN